MTHTLLRKSRLLLFAILILVAVALYHNYAVAERIAAAIWQWYKFKDYGGGGHVTLSRQTAIEFYCLSSMFILISIACARMMVRQSNCSKWIAWLPVFLFTAGVFAYTLLAFSPFNSWVK
jgi:hypothetical protein